MWSRTEQRDGCSKYGKEHIDLYFCKSAKQKLWVKIQHCETCKETGVGEYKCAYIFYILMDIFPFTKNLNGIDTSSEAAYILLWFVRTFCRQEEQCSVYIFSGMSDLIMDGHSTMMLPLVGETWREPLGKKNRLNTVCCSNYFWSAVSRWQRRRINCWNGTLLSLYHKGGWQSDWSVLCSEGCSNSEAAGCGPECGWRIFCWM